MGRSIAGRSRWCGGGGGGGGGGAGALGTIFCACFFGPTMNMTQEIQQIVESVYCGPHQRDRSTPCLICLQATGRRGREGEQWEVRERQLGKAVKAHGGGNWGTAEGAASSRERAAAKKGGQGREQPPGRGGGADV